MHLSMPYIATDAHQTSSGSIMSDSGTPQSPPGQQPVAGGIMGAGLLRGASERQPHQFAPGSILLINNGGGIPDGVQGHPLQTLAAISTSESPLPLTVSGSLALMPSSQTHTVTTSGNHSIPEAISIVSTSEHSHLNTVPVTVVLAEEPDRSAEIVTLNEVRVSGVESLEQYNKCITCSSKVIPDGTDPELGTCSQCSTMQRISDTKAELSASLVIRVDTGEFLRLQATDEAIESITRKQSTEVDVRKALLKAEPFNVSHKGGDVISITR